VVEVVGGLRNVGVPSIVVTMGLINPTNSCAEIFLTGVVPPEPDEPQVLLLEFP
jgi:hypothetical protein